MKNTWKTLQKIGFRKLLRHGWSALEMQGAWIKKRSGWRPAVVRSEPIDTLQPMLIFAVRLLLEEDGKILFLKQTPANGGRFSLPGGTVEEPEFARDALCRETLEELGVKLTPERLTLVHVLHRKKKELSETHVVFYFKAFKFKGEPESRERKKFNDVEWFPWYALPDQLSKHTRKVLNRISQGQIYSEMGKEK